MPLRELNTHSDTPFEKSSENVRINIRRHHPRFEMMDTFNKKLGDTPLAIVGGGPSLKKTIDELRSFQNVMAAGSVHDYLIEQNLIPNAIAVCDPSVVTNAYFKKPHKDVTYLLATQCDPSLFEQLEGYKIVMWHCYPIDRDFLDQVEPGWHAVSGGCTVTLRALSMAIMLGFSNLHFFGVDSCMGEVGDDEHHAYPYAAGEQTGRVYEVKSGSLIAGPRQKTFRCEGYQLAQAYHFKSFYKTYNHLFTPTFHGGGLIADWFEGVKEEIERLKAEQAA